MPCFWPECKVLYLLRCLKKNKNHCSFIFSMARKCSFPFVFMGECIVYCYAEGQSWIVLCKWASKPVIYSSSTLQGCFLDLYWFDFSMLWWKLPIDVLLKIVVFPKCCLNHYWSVQDDSSMMFVLSGFIFVLSFCKVSCVFAVLYAPHQHQH